MGKFKFYVSSCCASAVVLFVGIVLAALFEEPVTSKYVPSKSSGDAKSGGGARGLGSGKMFDSIAWAYDVTNRFMSLGTDQRWRRTMLDECLMLQPGDKVMDLATGTADVALLEGSRLVELGGAQGSVIGIDPSIEMLRHGVEKVNQSGLSNVVSLSMGDAQDLSSHTGVVSSQVGSIASGTIDKISMSFGIRNVPDRAKALREMHRVLKKQDSSKVCILEFSLPSGKTFLSKLSYAFVTNVIPFIGQIMTLGTGSDEYSYLSESIMKFPNPQDFAALMTSEGVPVTQITEFAYGAVQLYHGGVRIES